MFFSGASAKTSADVITFNQIKTQTMKMQAVKKSEIPNGVAVWTGDSDFTYFDPGLTTETIPVRLTLSLSGPGATEFIASSSLLTIDPTFDTSQEVVTEVTDDFSINLLAEAYMDSNWTPIDDLFDSKNTQPSDGTRTDFGTSFYSTVPEPSSALLVLMAGGAWLLKKRKRG